MILLHFELIIFRFAYGRTPDPSFLWFRDFWTCPWPPKPTIVIFGEPMRLPKSKKNVRWKICVNLICLETSISKILLTTGAKKCRRAVAPGGHARSTLGQNRGKWRFKEQFHFEVWSVSTTKLLLAPPPPNCSRNGLPEPNKNRCPVENRRISGKMRMRSLTESGSGGHLTPKAT